MPCNAPRPVLCHAAGPKCDPKKDLKKRQVLGDGADDASRLPKAARVQDGAGAAATMAVTPDDVGLDKPAEMVVPVKDAADAVWLLCRRTRGAMTRHPTTRSKKCSMPLASPTPKARTRQISSPRSRPPTTTPRPWQPARPKNEDLAYVERPVHCLMIGTSAEPVCPQSHVAGQSGATSTELPAWTPLSSRSSMPLAKSFAVEA